jgi:hypothetical protein
LVLMVSAPLAAQTGAGSQTTSTDLPVALTISSQISADFQATKKRTKR